MAYTPITPTEFREKGGVLVDKLGDEFRLIGDEFRLIGDELTAFASFEARIAALEEAASKEPKEPKEPKGA